MDKNEEVVEQKFEKKIEETAQRIGQEAEKFGKEIKSSIRPYERSGNIVWAIFLIFIGIMFLLNTTGFVPWAVWTYMWKFWPIFLVFAGLNILIGKSKIASLLLGFLALGVFVLAGLVSVTVVSPSIKDKLPIEIPQWLNFLVYDIGEPREKSYVISSESFGKNYLEVEERYITIDTGTVEVTVSDDSGSEFVEFDAEYFENYGVPLVKERVSEEELELSIKQSDSVGVVFDKLVKYALKFGEPDIPVSFDIKAGTGNYVISMQEVAVNNFLADSGVGSIKAEFGASSVPMGKIECKVGTGSIDFIVPANVGFRIKYEVGLGSVRVDNETVAQFGTDEDEFISENYSTAERSLDIMVDVGVGSFSLRTQ